MYLKPREGSRILSLTWQAVALMGMKRMFKHINICTSLITNVSNLHPLEVVGRGSETQLQVGEN